MKTVDFVRKFYKPIQPTISTDDRHILYTEAFPDSKIESFVYCYWQLKTVSPLKEPFIYKVVSDGCIDIFIDHNNPSLNFVMGFCRKFTEFPIGKTFDYIGIRFLPSAFPFLFGLNAKNVSNQSQELRLILPRVAEWIKTNINSNQTFSKITQLLNQRLLAKVNAQEFKFDSRFLKALHLIFLKKGCLATENDLNTGLSPRQLRRLFNYYIGTTPKAFSSVVRFQQILHKVPTKAHLKENKLYFDIGFYDQAHFIRDFKNFYGTTPTTAFP